MIRRWRSRKITSIRADSAAPRDPAPVFDFRAHFCHSAPMETITEAVHALPFGLAPSVVVAYPSFDDWMRLYKPLKSRTEQWKREMYADFKRRHERSTAAQLETIGRSLTGAAVLSEMNARPTYS